VNGLGRKPKTGAQAKQGQRRAGIVRYRGATTGASSNYATVVATQGTGEKTSFDGRSFDRNRLMPNPAKPEQKFVGHLFSILSRMNNK